MIIVSDTSPLSNLFIIGELELLRRMYKEIIIPYAVMNELLELESFGINIHEITNAPWIKTAAISKKEDITILLEDLDLGEAEAIALAKELHAE